MRVREHGCRARRPGRAASLGRRPYARVVTVVVLARAGFERKDGESQLMPGLAREHVP